MPDSLRLLVLLQRLPGYTREALEAEDADLVDDWVMYMQQEAGVAEERNRRR
mgnify:CR=1 FL=1|jgi:hypothetical protein